MSRYVHIPIMTERPRAHPDLGALASMLEDLGLLEVYRVDGERERYRLTTEGTRVREMLLMADGQDAGILLEARRTDRNPERDATPRGRAHL